MIFLCKKSIASAINYSMAALCYEIAKYTSSHSWVRDTQLARGPCTCLQHSDRISLATCKHAKYLHSTLMSACQHINMKRSKLPLSGGLFSAAKVTPCVDKPWLQAAIPSYVTSMTSMLGSFVVCDPRTEDFCRCCGARPQPVFTSQSGW